MSLKVQETLAKLPTPLYVLNFSGISLTETDLVLIGSHIKEQGWQLEEINFSNCSLRSLPISTWISEGLMSKVEDLDLSENLLTELPNLTGFNALKNLSVQGNQLIYFPLVSGVRTLQWINLAKNYIRNIPKDIRLPFLRFLNLSYNFLNEFTVEDLPNLVELNLKYNRISVYPDFKVYPRLKFVDLSFNYLESQPPIASQIKTLKLEGNRLPLFPDSITIFLMISFTGIIFIHVCLVYSFFTR